MRFTEKSLQCSDCGRTFPFTAEEQEFFASKGFTNEPQRCTTCRQMKRAERSCGNGGSYGNRGPRLMYPGTFARCGKPTDVLFQWNGDKAV